MFLFLFPTMMDNPHSETLTLPQSLKYYDIGISFSSDVTYFKKATFDNLVQPEIKVTYKQGGEKLAQKKMESSYVLGKGKLTWK